MSLADDATERSLELLERLKNAKRDYTPPTKGITVQMDESDRGRIVLTAVDAYRRSKGITWKNLTLLGIAQYMIEDAPELAEEVIGYVTDRRTRGQRD